ncbi:hypothetical protein QBC47DRAFT_412251 [Echria macrotheca]|uniref:Uncharacterized protein n=1 Tax=Echria macrotheca TaxID=438768 RepID=A0AAJ0BEM9_9PEZI|nr:hypothetical protein QBC47DRAFT_412251 [Echria macrotheca]
MIPFIILLLSVLATASITTPSATPIILGNWTLSSLSRSCSPTDNECHYAFDLHEVPSPSSPPSSSPSQPTTFLSCFLRVNGSSQDDFPQTKCDPEFETDSDRLSVSGGWSGRGQQDAFVTVVVTDATWGAYAFFGFSEAEFGEMGIVERSMTSPAFEVGSLTGRRRPFGLSGGDRVSVERQAWMGSGVDGMGMEKRGEERRDGGGGEGGSLQILRLRKYFEQDQKATYLSFLVSSSLPSSQTQNPTTCELRIPNTAPNSSWYGLVCDPYSISWGYESATDGAIMTVCDASTGMDAFFGFDHVNQGDSVVLGDSGWEPLHDTGYMPEAAVSLILLVGMICA